MSAITASLRTDGAFLCTLQEFRTALVPFPRVSFLLPSLAPLASVERCCCYTRPTIKDLTSDCFSHLYNFANCDVLTGKFMGCALLYRGDIVPKDISTAIGYTKTRRDINFVDWSPTGFKCGISYLPERYFPDGDIRRVTQSACMLSNSTAFGPKVSKMLHKFDIMFSKRAYVHWFKGEGMEEELAAAREDIFQLERDYEECAAECLDEGGGEGCEDEY